MFAIGFVALFNKRARMLGMGHRRAFPMLRRQVQKGEDYIWFHAASLGEFEQGRPLMERLRRELPQYKILLTFFSPSGYEVRKDYKGADVICYLPLDTPTNVRLFFHYVKPKMAIFIKYEFWQNYLKGCKKRGIPVYSVSSIFRPHQIFFRWYGRHGYAKVLDKVTWFFVQNEQSRQLLATLGHHNVSIVGDTRFDRVIDICKTARPLPAIAQFVSDAPQVFVAGSSWPPDEALFIPWFKEQPRNSMKLIIAPHIISEDHLRDIENALSGLRVIRYSEASANLQDSSGNAQNGAAVTASEAPEADVLIIDCFGLLSSIYRYATVAMVGGGFGAGIHNIAEAAVYGVPTLIGPNNTNFREARYLLQAGGTFEVHDEGEFRQVVNNLLSDANALRQASEAARTYIHSNAGATEVVFKHIFGGQSSNNP